MTMNPNIEIYCFNTKQTIIFDAYITDFFDSYKSAWRTEEVFGRMDPIATFKNTSRSAGISFDIPANKTEEAKENLKKIETIIKSLYPIYEDLPSGNSTLASPPMFRVRFSNLIQNSFQNDAGSTLRNGLLCYIENFDFRPKTDSGFFIQDSNLYPKLISVVLNLKIIHEHPLGFSKQGQTRTGFINFPYRKPTNIVPTTNAATAAPAAIANTTVTEATSVTAEQRIVEKEKAIENGKSDKGANALSDQATATALGENSYLKLVNKGIQEVIEDVDVDLNNPTPLATNEQLAAARKAKQERENAKRRIIKLPPIEINVQRPRSQNSDKKSFVKSVMKAVDEALVSTGINKK